MRKNGFTLTEVIITIAIVGVVAAMTIPTLITTHRKQVLATSLASAMADFQSSINNMIIKEGVNDLFGTQAWSALRNDEGRYVLNNSLNTEDNSPILNNFLMQIRKTLLVEGYDINQPEYNNIDNAIMKRGHIYEQNQCDRCRQCWRNHCQRPDDPGCCL